MRSPPSRLLARNDFRIDRASTGTGADDAPTTATPVGISGKRTTSHREAPAGMPTRRHDARPVLKITQCLLIGVENSLL